MPIRLSYEFNENPSTVNHVIKNIVHLFTDSKQGSAKDILLTPFTALLRERTISFRIAGKAHRGQDGNGHPGAVMQIISAMAYRVKEKLSDGEKLYAWLVQQGWCELSDQPNIPPPARQARRTGPAAAPVVARPRDPSPPPRPASPPQVIPSPLPRVIHPRPVPASLPRVIQPVSPPRNASPPPGPYVIHPRPVYPPLLPRVIQPVSPPRNASPPPVLRPQALRPQEIPSPPQQQRFIWPQVDQRPPAAFQNPPLHNFQQQGMFQAMPGGQIPNDGNIFFLVQQAPPQFIVVDNMDQQMRKRRRSPSPPPAREVRPRTSVFSLIRSFLNAVREFIIRTRPSTRRAQQQLALRR